MSQNPSPADPKGTAFKPLVPASSDMTEFTVRALILGLVMCVVLGAANAYLGLRAGMTIAATYPAAVIGMAVLRLFRGSILEENFARTVGSIGESVAAGAIFTIPAFVILNLWKFDAEHMGGVPALVGADDPRRHAGHHVRHRPSAGHGRGPVAPFPESVAASEIHKAGQRGTEAALQLFQAMGVGALIRLLDGLRPLPGQNDVRRSASARSSESFVRLGLTDDSRRSPPGGVTTFSAPDVTPAYLGVGYIIGPELGALNFAGGLLAWGLFVPLLVFFLGPDLIDQYMAASGGNEGRPGPRWRHLWRFIVRPIAVGGMLVGACFTLYRMRKNLIGGIKRSIADVKKSAAAAAATERTERDLSLKVVGLGIAVVFVLMVALYLYFTGTARRRHHRGHRDAGHRLLLRGRLGQPGRHDRLVEQPDLGPDAGHHDRRGADHGDHRRQGDRGRGWRCWASRPSAACRPPWPARCCRTSRWATSWAARPGRCRSATSSASCSAGLVMFFPLYVLHNSDLAQYRRGRRVRRQEPIRPRRPA